MDLMRFPPAQAAFAPLLAKNRHYTNYGPGDSQLVKWPVGVEKVRDRNVLLAAINAGIEFSSHFNYVAASVLSTVG